MQESYTLLDRPRDHCVRHGHEVALSYFLQEAMQKEQVKVVAQTSNQLKRVQDVPYMECAAPSRDSQMIELFDIMADSADVFAGVAYLDLDWTIRIIGKYHARKS